MKLTRKQNEAFTGYLFIGIWIIGLLVFTLFPIAQSFYYSLFDAKITEGGIVKNQYLGFKSYLEIFNYIYFFEALLNYIKNQLVMVPLITVFSVIIGTLLNQDIKFKSVFRIIYFIPAIIVSGTLITRIQSIGGFDLMEDAGSSGFIALITDIFPTSIQNLMDHFFEKIVLVLWFTGIPVILILTGLQKKDRTIYEAASIDGASSWEAFWKITLPSLKPLINVVIVYSMISTAVFTSKEAIDIIDARKSVQYGMSNAFAWIYFAVELIILGIFLFLVNFRYKNVKMQLKQRKKVKKWRENHKKRMLKQ